MTSTCGGGCCAVFFIPPGMLDSPSSDQMRYIADMVIPLTRRQALARYRKFVGGDPAWKGRRDSLAKDTLHTCRHWDEETRLCGAYDERPDMCRNYPYGKPCSLTSGCDYQIEDPDGAIAARYGNAVETPQ